MFDLTKDDAGFYRLTISGHIDEDQMRAGLDAFLDSTEGPGKSDYLYKISDFEFPSLQAIAVEFGYIPRLFATLPRIGKVALIADQEWLRKAAEIEGKILPGMTIETFKPGEEARAEAWLVA